jgi:hypothetical protein
MKRFVTVVLVLLFTLTGAAAGAQMQHDGEGSGGLDLYPGEVDYDPAIPTLEQVVGHDWGERITSPDELYRYLDAIAAATPRVTVHEYARSWEGRPLHYVVVGSEANMARIVEIRTDNVALADPRSLTAADADRIVGSAPVITWLAYGVHGNEISSSDAALATIYHLAAAQNDPVADTILANSIVVLDPMQNPDGRNRFSNNYRQAKGLWPDGNNAAAELNEPWPGGRTNHYLFDLNRDWFAQTQPETKGKVAAFMQWRPQVYIDLHEMGGNSSYYFPPQADPRNPNEAESITSWIGTLGENNARWFDRMGFDYFQREVFDAFYPGYGVSWPLYQGAIGATYEEASSRGLLYDRNDETTLTFKDTVHRHFIASISTAEMAAENREQVLRDFVELGRSAIAEGERESMREIVIDPSRDPGRADHLVALLMSQGVEVAQASEAFANTVSDYYGGEPMRREFPAGSYRISMAQPAKRLIKVLMAPETPMDEEFLREQRRRYARREGDQIYDISGWSLPLLFDLDAYSATEPSTSADVMTVDLLAEAPATTGGVHGEPATVAYMVPWGTQSAAFGLAAMHRHGMRVHSAGEAFTIGGRTYPQGSLIIKVAGNSDNLHDQLSMIGSHHGVDIYPTNTSQVTDGPNFGSGRVRYLPAPRVALLWDSPTSSNSAGWARYLLEVAFHTPVTIIRTSQLGRADLDDFNVLIMPDAFSFGGGGGYGGVFGGGMLDNLKEWVREGGTLITLGAATQWATTEDVGLIATERKMKSNEEGVADPGEDTPATGLPDGVYPEEESPTPLPGPILRAQLDTEHWLASGYGDRINLIAQSRNIYTPLTLDKGINVATYLPVDDLLVSGVAWQPELEMIAGTPFLMYVRQGGGHVVAFVEDPNYRAYFDGLNLLFLNGVMLGPGY